MNYNTIPLRHRVKRQDMHQSAAQPSSLTVYCVPFFVIWCLFLFHKKLTVGFTGYASWKVQKSCDISSGGFCKFFKVHANSPIFPLSLPFFSRCYFVLVVSMSNQTPAAILRWVWTMMSPWRSLFACASSKKAQAYSTRWYISHSTAINIPRLCGWHARWRLLP